jgi:hypothetical protein
LVNRIAKESERSQTYERLIQERRSSDETLAPDSIETHERMTDLTESLKEVDLNSEKFEVLFLWEITLEIDLVRRLNDRDPGRVEFETKCEHLCSSCPRSVGGESRRSGFAFGSGFVWERSFLDPGGEDIGVDFAELGDSRRVSSTDEDLWSARKVRSTCGEGKRDRNCDSPLMTESERA